MPTGLDKSTDDPRIRPVDSSHIADLIRIADETNLSAWTAQNYLDEFQMPGSIMLRLESDLNVTIGFVVGRIVEAGVVETEQQAEIYNIAIDKSEQGKGLGQLLFDAFIAKCREHKVTSVWLEVRESNEKAIGFYKTNSFEHVQTRDNFYNNPREAALLMKLILK
ncbi:MAG: ribosomal protein S18-alanine N-acetyltransferase [Chloracidobacterium sp.]|nr:ribosomal protein S18-alanine N-acetyltransferase [Chloracidobacterium sp.]